MIQDLLSDDSLIQRLLPIRCPKKKAILTKSYFFNYYFSTYIRFFSFLAVLHKPKGKKSHVKTTDLSNVQLTKRWVCNTAQAWSMHSTPDTGLQLYTCSQAFQQKKRCFTKRHPGSGLILIHGICPSNCALSSTGRMKWR